MIQISYKSQYSPYDRFIHLLNSPETQRTYTKHLNQFLRYCKFGKYEQLLEEISDTEKFELITDFLIYLKKERNVSPSTINITFSAIKRFYKSNRVAALDWDQLAYYKGKFTGKVIEDRLYTNEEIKQLLDCADLREKVLVYILFSTGMRIGGLTELKLRDLTFMENKKIYQFKVYSESIPDRYITFCTPECAEIINKYLKYRENQGDTLKPSSPLIYRKVTRYDKKNKKVIFDNQFDRPMTSQSVQQIFTRLQRRSSIFPKEQVEEQENKIHTIARGEESENLL